MKKIRFGIVGTGKISSLLIAGGKQDPRFEAVAVCSRTAERAEAFAREHNISHTFTSLEEMADSPLVDVVYIASPNYAHARQSILCMSRGKHVLCEKPLAANAREARRMIETARQHGVLLMEAMVTTLNPNFALVRKQLPRLGTIRRYFASYCQYSSRYDKFKEGIVLNTFKPELSNGSTLDIGIYTIYPMVALFGCPKQITAQGLKLSTGVDGQGAVNFQYEGMNATVLYSKIANSHLPTEIEGEEGNLLLDEIHIPHRVEYRNRKEGTTQSLGIPPEKSEYYYEIAEFIDLLERGKQESEVNSHRNSLITMEILDEIRRQLGVHYPSDEEE